MKTNFEEIKKMNIEDFAHFLCCVSSCNRCPVTNKCFELTKSKGFKNLKQWLESECEE